MTLEQTIKDFKLKAEIMRHQGFNGSADQFELAVESMERDVGLEPKLRPEFYGRSYRCPNCDKYIAEYEKPTFCENCGTKIKWKVTSK